MAPSVPFDLPLCLSIATRTPACSAPSYPFGLAPLTALPPSTVGSAAPPPTLPRPPERRSPGTMRECSCSLCSQGVLGGTSLVPERTWFYNNLSGGNSRRKRACVSSPTEDSCRSGWGAFVAHRESHASCDYCGAARRLSSGAPDKQTVYYSLSAWLRTMLADPEVGPSMTAAMAEARAAAKAPVDRVRDWHDGMKFREAGAAGLFDTDLCVALSISMDGF